MISLSEFLFISSIIKMLVVCVLKKTIHLLQHQDTGCSQISGKKYIFRFLHIENLVKRTLSLFTQLIHENL